MRRHWKKEHLLLMRKEEDYRMTELAVLGYHCQVCMEQSCKKVRAVRALLV